MALQPSLRYTSFGTGPNTLEFYLDLLCPFSGKLTRFLSSYLLGQVAPGGKYADKLRIIIRPYPQPWHGTSTYLNEASLAFGKAFCSGGKESDSNLWFSYCEELIRKQEEFYDKPASIYTSDQIRDKLAIIAGELAEKQKLGPSSKAAGQVRDLLALKGTPNGGTAVTDDLKYLVKLGRQNSIHVTPSALFNGLFDGSISSGWTEEEWTKYLSGKGL